MKEEIRKYSTTQVIGWMLFAAGMLLAAAAIFACFSTDIWYDELFTMGFAEKSIIELVGLTAKDVHPPFYYLYVKAVTEFCGLLFPFVSPVIIGKLCSILPFFLLLLYGATKIRRHFGIFTAGLFSFCIISMPQLPQYASEIRMYSLALFLVTAALLHGYEIMGDTDKKGDWLLLAIYGILAAYTHYFAAAAIGVLYVLLFVTVFRDKKKHKNWLICAVISGVCYLPWLFALFSQVAKVKENYWILPLTLRSLGGCIKFLLKPAFADEWLNILVAVILFLLYVLFAWMAFTKRKEKNKQDWFAFCCVLLLAGVVLFGFLASFLIRPIFIYRYMLPAMGGFWLGFAIWAGRFVKRLPLMISLVLLLAVVGGTGYKAFFNEEIYKSGEMEKTMEALWKINKDDAVIFNFNHMQAVASYYLENETKLWETEPEVLIREMFDKNGMVSSAAEIRSWLLEGKTVWFLGSGNAREELIKNWEKEGISATEEASCLLERYWFNLYRLSTNDT